MSILDETDDDEAWQFADEIHTILAALSPNVSLIKKDKGQSHLLTAWESSQLRKVYKVLCPEYASLETLYEAEKRHAGNARRLATFPSISCWQPESHHLASDEANMLQGGDTCANKFHHIHLGDKTKGAIWVLRGAEMEAEQI